MTKKGQSSIQSAAQLAAQVASEEVLRAELAQLQVKIHAEIVAKKAVEDAKAEAGANVAANLAGARAGAKSVVPTSVLSGAETAQADAIRGLGVEIIQAVGAVAGKYLQLCLYIRRNAVAQKLVAFELQRLGFKRSRISEVNRVSQASDAVFAQYQAKLIGFDKCLNLSRVEKPGTLPVATVAAQELVRGHYLNSEEVDSIIQADQVSGGKGRPSSAKPASTKKQLEAAAKLLCSKSGRDKVYRFDGLGYEVVVRKLPASAVTAVGTRSKV